MKSGSQRTPEGRSEVVIPSKQSRRLQRPCMAGWNAIASDSSSPGSIVQIRRRVTRPTNGHIMDFIASELLPPKPIIDTP